MAQQNLDLYYPQILDKNGHLMPAKVNDAMKRAFDFIYAIDPPDGSSTSSSLTGLNEDNIDSLSADRITSGTLAVGVEIILTATSTSTPTPAKLTFQSTGSLYASTTTNVLFMVPVTDKTNFIYIGSNVAGNTYRWKGINLMTAFSTNSIITLKAIDDAGGDSGYRIQSTTGSTSNHIWHVAGTDEMELSGAALFPSTTSGSSLGLTGTRWLDLWLSGAVKAGTWNGTKIGIAYGGTNLTTTPTNGKLLIGNGTDYTLANLTGTTSQVVVTNGAGSITLSLPQNIDTGATPTFANLVIVSQALIEDIVTNSGNDLFLDPQGGGVVKFGTRTALGAETLSGFITIKDAGGTTRKLAVVS